MLSSKLCTYFAVSCIFMEHHCRVCPGNSLLFMINMGMWPHTTSILLGLQVSKDNHIRRSRKKELNLENWFKSALHSAIYL